MKKTILNVSFDETVAASRQNALEEAGYAVVSTTQVADALQRMASVAFDLLIVGHRFSNSDKRRLSTEARERGTSVLLICGASADSDIPADARVYALEGTAGVISALDGLLHLRSASSAGKAA